MSIPGPTINPYDEIPFPSQPLPQSHPDRLAALGRLFGMQPPPVDRCRVLELGCATGGNLVPMAEAMPEARFVGVDYSQAQVLAAQHSAAAVKLENLELRQEDIAKLGDELGNFDYIICHGVFAWVPRPLQDKILELCQRALAPQGVAYISYNTYPGWHLRSVLRELLCQHATGNSSTERLARGRSVLELFSAALENEQTPYGRLMISEIKLALSQPDGYLYHEYMEEDNSATYLHEFVARAEEYGLGYLADAPLATMFASNFGSTVERQLLQIAGDTVGIEQHLDLLRNRGFRQTLLCRKEVPLVRKIVPAQLQGLYFRGYLKAQQAMIDLRSTAQERFTTPRGLGITTPSPPLKAVIHHLTSCWPRACSHDELFDAAARLLGSDDAPAQFSAEQRTALGHNLVQCLASGLLEVSAAPDRFVTTISDKPLASRMARFEANRSKKVTNRTHELIELDDASRNLLPYLDGRHDRQALLKELVEAIDRGDVSILVEGLPVAKGAAVAGTLESTLDISLRHLARVACLVA